jgi:hypothetical protein
LTECIPETEKPFLGPGLFFIAPRAANAAVETKLFDCAEQDGNL